VCPWCYIGFQRIEQLEQEFPVEVEWRPFELHPETPTTGADLRGRLGSSERARAYRDNIIALANDSGIDMHMPLVVANSHLSLEAAECVRETTPELFRRYHRALFHAYFEDRRDLGDAEVLCEIARDVGADDQGLRQALADRTYAERIDETTRLAREDEILSTPTFIYEESGFRLTGAQDYAVFKSITQRLLRRRSSEKNS
jgi:predicted DsbA family dithiol-disulfide isomerase